MKKREGAEGSREARKAREQEEKEGEARGTTFQLESQNERRQPPLESRSYVSYIVTTSYIVDCIEERRCARLIARDCFLRLALSLLTLRRRKRTLRSSPFLRVSVINNTLIPMQSCVFHFRRNFHRKLRIATV